jgi:hypothetical protein
MRLVAPPRPSLASRPPRPVSLQPPKLIVFVLSVLGVLIAAAVTDNGDDGQGFGARCALLYVTLMNIGYMISRGLAKAGSHRR